MSAPVALEPVLELVRSCGVQMAAARAQQVAAKPGAGLVSEVDLQLERQLRAGLLALVPHSTVCGEEEGGCAAELTWWLDPLDGTTNFVHGWPRSAITLALYERSQALLAVTHDPYLGETFWALKHQGAFRNGQRLRVSGVTGLQDALLTTGFADEPAEQWDFCRQLQARSRGVRVSGCCALDCAYVAAGRVDAYWEIDLKPWDVAAGLLLVQEAGGECLDRDGNPAQLSSGDFLFATPALAPELLAAWRRAVQLGKK